MINFVPQREPPYTERYVRWCERTGVSRPLLLDHNFITVYSELVHLKHFGHGEEADRVERETVLPPILERSFNAV
jgi:hypothetical protein